MFYKNILFITILLFLTNCTTGTLINNQTQQTSKTLINVYSNTGFALIYNEDFYNKKIINNKIDDRSLIIFQKNLKNKTKVKITNILNNKSLIATVGKNSTYPSFNNSVLSKRIAIELNLDIDQPYVEILEISESSIFVAKKAKTFDEEKSVAIKVPVESISVNNLKINKKVNKKKSIRIFSYNIKIADFYFNSSALTMLNRIENESLIRNAKSKKISDNKYRVFLGPFNNINSLQKSYNDISILEFENIEIIKNE